MNKPILKCFLFLCIFNISFVKAQENTDTDKKLKFIGIEAGINGLFCKSPEYDFIRGDVLSYYTGASESLKGLMSKNYVGLKVEFRKKENQLGLLFGIRYSRLNASLGKDSYFSSASEYFYFFDNQTGTTTEYFRVKEINRTIDYLEVPLELRWISDAPRDLRFYMKLGLDLGFKINSSSKVSFYNDYMSDYEDNVISKFDNSGSFYSAAYLSAGINFDKKPDVDLELIFPYVLLTPKMSGILTAHAGIGIKVEIRLPF